VDEAALLLTDRAALVDGIAEHVHDAAERLAAHRHGDRCTGVLHRQAAGEALGGAHGNGAHDTVTELLLHFEGQVFFRDLQGVINLRHGIAGKLHVDNRADDLYDSSATHVRSSSQIHWGDPGMLPTVYPLYLGNSAQLIAAAPLTISDSSWVIAAWRALL
jgi:hypothetical protein